MKRLEETASDFAMAKKSAQEAEINHMADILTSLTNHSDQVCFTLCLSQRPLFGINSPLQSFSVQVI
jgi:hypothetical protein